MEAFPVQTEEEEEEKEEEFFETLDTIPSSPSSLTSSDQNENGKDKDNAVMMHSTFARYEVWTNESISIIERRERLFKQMGRSKGQDNADALDLPSSDHPVKVVHGSLEKLYNDIRCPEDEDAIKMKQNSSGSAVIRPAEEDNEEEEEEEEEVEVEEEEEDVDAEGAIVDPPVLSQVGTEKGNTVVKDPGSDDREIEVNNQTVHRLRNLDTNRERSLTEEEFKNPIGLSPLDQELLKREEERRIADLAEIKNDTGDRSEKKKTWFHTLKGLVWSSRENKSISDDRTSSVESSARRLGNDSKDSHKMPKRVKVYARKKSTKEFTDLYLQQCIQAHEGAIWTMKFSLDGCFLASAGVDKVVKLWEVIEQHGNCSPDDSRNSYVNQISRTNGTMLRNSLESNHLLLLSENTKWSFRGHTEDIMDLSWSPSQILLSSSMDKTVRLWNVVNGECLKIFKHSDYVTCIHFNPVNDGYFISGSLDGTVRIWSIKNRQVIDWLDLNEMITAACYTPDGQGAVVGSYKGICRFLKMSVDNKLQVEKVCEVQRKTYKHAQGKKITGLQFIPGSNDKVLITSNDSRIRVHDGSIVSSKHKGLRNTKSQISASLSSDGTYIISASEDSRVCIWRRYPDTSLEQQSPQKDTVPGAHEHFSARDVSVAIPWPRKSSESVDVYDDESHSSVLKRSRSHSETNHTSNPCGLEVGKVGLASHVMDMNSVHERVASSNSDLHQDVDYFHRYVDYSVRSSASVSHTSSIMDRYLEDCSVLSKDLPSNQSGAFSDGSGSVTWPEESFQEVTSFPQLEAAVIEHVDDRKISTVSAAHGFVIVTGSLGGLIKIYQNHSPPL